MDMVNIYVQMEQYMKENGKKINNMEKEKKYGLMVLGMKVIILMVKNMVKENFIGLMVLHMKENFLIII